MSMRGRMWVVGTMVMCCTGQGAWAADGEVGTVQQGVAVRGETRQQVMDAIETVRQTNPELADEMARQMELVEHEGNDVGDLELPPEMIGPLVGGEVPIYQQLEDGPRMQELRRQVESGALEEDGAREQVFEILRSYGIEPDEGREWDQMKGEEYEPWTWQEKDWEEHMEDFEILPHHEMIREMMEREGMSKEDMDRFFEPEGAWSEMEHYREYERPAYEREHEMPPSLEPMPSPERDYHRDPGMEPAGGQYPGM